MKMFNQEVNGVLIQLAANSRGIEGNVATSTDRFRVLKNESLTVTKLTEAGRIDANETEFKMVADIIADILPNFQKLYVVERCTSCKKNVSEKVKTFSSGKFGKVLCFDCQKQHPKLVSDSLAATCPPWLLNK